MSPRAISMVALDRPDTPSCSTATSLRNLLESNLHHRGLGGLAVLPALVLDQRWADGDLLLRHRSRDQARADLGRAARPSQRGPPRDRGARWGDRSRRDLPRPAAIAPRALGMPCRWRRTSPSSWGASRSSARAFHRRSRSSCSRWRSSTTSSRSSSSRPCLAHQSTWSGSGCRRRAFGRVHPQ